MKEIRKRWIEGRLKSAMGVMPAVVLTGARQTGKSTLARSHPFAEGRDYHSLDRMEVLELALRSPAELLRRLPVTLDEVQRAPSLLAAVKVRVDEERETGDRPGGILLTGSANLALVGGVSESLAGRAGYVSLPPFCPGEWLGDQALPGAMDLLFAGDFDPRAWPSGPSDWGRWVVRGGYPGVLEMDAAEARDIWFEGYVATYLERDLRQLSAVAHLPDFQRLMKLAASRCGRLVNQSAFGREVHLPVATTHRYLNLLEAGCQIARLPNYRTSASSSAAKAQKLFWTDSGLGAWLAGVSKPSERPDAGYWLEQLVFQNLQAWAAAGPRRSVSYWRDGAREVDFVIEQADQLVAIEVKSATVPTGSDFSGLRAFQSAFTKQRKPPPLGVVLSPATVPLAFGEHLYSLPLAPFAPARE
jgi:predicted AAA+ superfamily ATPase